MSTADQREEVQRILRSAQFRRAPKLQRFLELVCDYHFQGRSAEINEFAIATQAFGKGPDFEPSEDSLVRVQAREIRRRLREYYQSEGKASRLILDIPIGHYAPVFTSLDAVAPTARRAPSLRSAWLILTGTVLACAALLIAADHERRLLMQHGFRRRAQHDSQRADRRTVEPLPGFRRADAAGGEQSRRGRVQRRRSRAPLAVRTSTPGWAKRWRST